ncbi:hypothetical protein V8C86DRAFT_2679557 [Haematococcus lacustris]
MLRAILMGSTALAPVFHIAKPLVAEPSTIYSSVSQRVAPILHYTIWNPDCLKHTVPISFKGWDEFPGDGMA